MLSAQAVLNVNPVTARSGGGRQSAGIAPGRCRRAQTVVPEALSEAAKPTLMAISDTGERVEDMGSSTRIMRAALLAVAALLAFAASQLREKHQDAEAAVQDIHDQLDALDPATRAAVVARLTSDEVKKVHDLRQ